MDKLINFADFEKLHIHVGLIIDAQVNEQAKIPAYILTIDFGRFGTKTSSAQLTQNYTAKDLVGKKICAVINFPVKKIAGVKSEVLVLASMCEQKGTLLLAADENSLNGSRIG